MHAREKYISLALASVGFAGALLHCKGDEIVERPLALTVLEDCPLPNRESSTALVSLLGYATAKQVVVPWNGTASPIAIDRNVRGLSVSFETEGPTFFAHLGALDEADALAALLLPSAKTCSFRTPGDARIGGRFVSLSPSALLEVGGRMDPTAESWVWNVRNGSRSAPQSDLLLPREDPTVVAQEGVALVVGGTRVDGAREVLATAEVMRMDVRTSEVTTHRPPITLSGGRVGAGAVWIAKDRALILGGRRDAGNGEVLRSLELLLTDENRAETAGLASLDHGRSFPEVIALASKEILVVGGTDTNGAPVSSIEWLSKDGRSHSKRTTDLPLGIRTRAVPMLGGGALLVSLPAVVAPTEEAQADVWIVGADGSLARGNRVPVLASFDLFREPRGTVVLVSGEKSFRWQPMRGAFELGATGFEAGTPNVPRLMTEGVLFSRDQSRLSATRLLRETVYDAYAVDPNALSPELYPDHYDATLWSIANGITLLGAVRLALPKLEIRDFTLRFEGRSAPLFRIRSAGGGEVLVGTSECPYATAPGSKGGSVYSFERKGKIVTGAQQCVIPSLKGELTLEFVFEPTSLGETRDITSVALSPTGSSE
ncbi:MAG: hypothetical protein KBF88_10175 [Polyangiaceae bacterium]|nr:hypothetical protein [Polyangiaceae bacterium]